MKQDELDPKPRRTLIASDFALDAEPLASPSPPISPTSVAPVASIEPPRVVIAYRRDGLPLQVAIPLMVLLVLAALAAYHRLMRWAYVHPQAGSSPVASVAPAKVEPDPETKVEPAEALAVAEPLSLSSHQVAPSEITPAPTTSAELVGPPRLTEPEPEPETSPATTLLKPLNWPPKRGILDVAAIPSPFQRPLNTLERALLFSTLEPPPEPGRVPEPSKAKPIESIAKPEVKVADNPAPSTSPETVKEPEPAKLPSREEVMEAIKRESEQKKTEQAELKQFKEETPQRVRETWNTEVRAQRPKFLAELRSILRERKGEEAALVIEGLYKGYIHDVDPEMREQMMRMGRRFSGRTTLKAKIAAFRSVNFPEPTILEFATKEFHRRLHSSRCSCYTPQMYVLAARELLAAEIPPRARPKADTDDESPSPPHPRITPARPASTGNRGTSRTQ